MWLKNPLAHNVIELQHDFVWGDGITFKAEDEAVQEVLDEFWEDPANDWENKGGDRIRDLSLHGELLLIPDTKVSGKVKMANIYPERITGVKRTGEDVTDLILINPDDEMKIIVKDDLTGGYEGDVFLYQVNKVSFRTRGLSDLFFARDWFRLYDKSLYATMERAGLLLSHIWDITIKGGTEQQLREKFSQIVKNPPRPGGFRVHNEKEKWDEITPKLQGNDFENLFRLFKSQIIGGTRHPEHFFGMGGDINVGTAKVMSEPYFKKIKRRQRFIKKMFRDIFNYVIWQAKKANVLPEGVNDKFIITIPDPNSNIATQIADTVLKFSQSLTLLESNNYIDANTANAVIKMLFNQLGIDANINEESKESYRDALKQYYKNKYDDV